MAYEPPKSSSKNSATKPGASSKSSAKLAATSGETKSGMAVMAGSEVTLKECDAIEGELAALRVSYEHYFMGVDRVPPTRTHEDLKKRLERLKSSFVRNTSAKFRVQAIHSKFVTYERLWLRTLQEIENGTYKRDVAKARRRLEKLKPTAAKGPGAEPIELPDEDYDVQEVDEVVESAPASPSYRGVPAVPSIAPAVPSIAPAVPSIAPAVAPMRTTSRPAMPAVAPLVPSIAPAVPSIAPAVAPLTGAPARTTSRPAMPAVAPVVPPIAPAVAPRVAPVVPPVARAVPPVAPSVAPAVAPSVAPVSAPRVPAATPPKVPGVPAVAAVRPPPAAPRPPAAAAAVRPASAATAGDLSDDKLKTVYDAYVAAKRRNKEDTSKMSYDTIAASLRKQVPELMKQHNAKAVEFKVVIKDGKAVLKAVPK